MGQFRPKKVGQFAPKRVGQLRTILVGQYYRFFHIGLAFSKKNPFDSKRDGKTPPEYKGEIPPELKKEESPPHQ